MRTTIYAVIGIIFLTLLTSCAENEGSTESADNIKELVHEYSVGKIEAKAASITSNELIVTKANDTQKTYDLPNDEFFVSIAPYVDETHT